MKVRWERRSEKRICVRVPAQLIFTNSSDPMRARTINLSASGVFCSVPESIPTLTRVQLSLILPLRVKGHVCNRILNFAAVIVRTGEGDSKDNCRAALFFSGATDKQKRLIRRYVRQHRPVTVAC